MNPHPSSSDAAVAIEGVTKRFVGKTAVDHLDLIVPMGSVCGFLGPNGAGKTTTIRMIMSIIYPDSGAISVLGRPGAVESKERIGYLPEERGVYRKMRIGEFLTYIARLKGVHATGLNAKIDDWLERVDLKDVRKKKCEELSKGMQQKIQFLAAIIHDPELIILDEPFSGLDPVNARLLRTLIREMQVAGKTIIFSTHVLSSAEQLCDRIFMINKGRKVLDGPIDAIRSRFDPKTIIIDPAEGAMAQAEAALAAAPGVQSVTRVDGQAALLEGRLADHADPDAVMRAVVGRVALRRIELRRASLEDIFVTLVAPEDSEDSVRALVTDQSAHVGVSADA